MKKTKYIWTSFFLALLVNSLAGDAIDIFIYWLYNPESAWQWTMRYTILAILINGLLNALSGLFEAESDKNSQAGKQT